MDLDLINRWDRRARERWRYLADAADAWRSHADDVLAGRAWRGDCDDLASTALDLLARAGCPLDRLWRLIVTAAGGQRHMVGCVQADDGRLWIVGDTFGACYRAESMAHSPVQSCRLDEAHADDNRGLWREGAPWTLERAD